jgi:spore photoproduct lyase
MTFMASGLFDEDETKLPVTYEPRAVTWFQPERIILTKGSCATAERETFVKKICAAYPAAKVIEAFDLNHNQVAVAGDSLIEKHRAGKRTLVIGELKSAVRFSEEEGNTCPNYWHFSPYGFCPYGCRYCYLAGTIGVKFSPTVKIFVNLPEMLAEVERISRQFSDQTTFYVGKLQDGLALDGLTGYSRVMVPFFAGQEKAKLVVLTKSDDVGNLLDLEHKGRTILSWSVNPLAVTGGFEENTPSVESRLRAMEQCAVAGYPVRAVLMPVVPVDGWRENYRTFIAEMLTRVKLDRLTIGGICSYVAARQIMNAKLGDTNEIEKHLCKKSVDGRRRYDKKMRIEMYRFLVEAVRQRRPDLTVALCLEEADVWQAVGVTENLGRCNCVG